MPDCISCVTTAGLTVGIVLVAERALTVAEIGLQLARLGSIRTDADITAFLEAAAERGCLLRRVRSGVYVAQEAETEEARIQQRHLRSAVHEIMASRGQN